MDVKFISLKHIVKRKKESMYASGGIALSLCLIIVAGTIFSGFRKNLENSFLTFSGHIDIYGTNPRNIINQIENNKSIDEYVFLQEQTGIISSDSASQGILIHSVDKLSKVIKHKLHLELDKLQSDEIILGAGLGRKIKAEEGHIVRIALPNANIPLRVVKIIDFGIEELNNKMCFTDLSFHNDKREEIGTVQIFLKNVKNTDKIYNEIKTQKGAYKSRWYDIHRNLLIDISLHKAVSDVILGLILLMAGFIIIVILSNQVKEKTKDIGILKSIGFSNEDIGTIFFIEGAILTLVGCLLGILSSIIIIFILRNNMIFFPVDIYNMKEIPLFIDLKSSILTILLVIGVSLAASIYPSQKAAKMRPIDALKHEM